MKELKNFNVLSVGKVFGLFGLIFSIIQVIFLKLMSMNSAFAFATEAISGGFTLKAILLGITSATIIYFIIGLVVALIYNLIARYAGGVMFDSLDSKAPVKKRAKNIKKVKKK